VQLYAALLSRYKTKSFQTASRLTWTFARDEGLIASSRLSRLNARWEAPIWALCANAAVIFIIGCLYLGSSTAFNAFIGTGLILQLVTFAFPAALLLLRKRSDRFLPETRAFRLPFAFGWLANACTVGFSLLCFVCYNLPTVLPVHPSNMSKLHIPKTIASDSADTV
jgi:choline transport protein